MFSNIANPVKSILEHPYVLIQTHTNTNPHKHTLIESPPTRRPTHMVLGGSTEPARCGWFQVLGGSWWFWVVLCIRWNHPEPARCGWFQVLGGSLYKVKPPRTTQMWVVPSSGWFCVVFCIRWNHPELARNHPDLGGFRWFWWFNLLQVAEVQ